MHAGNPKCAVVDLQDKINHHEYIRKKQKYTLCAADIYPLLFHMAGCIPCFVLVSEQKDMIIDIRDILE